MDGGRRVLRSLRGFLSAALPVTATPSYAGLAPAFPVRSPAVRPRPRTSVARWYAFAAHPATGLGFCALVLAGVGAFGAVRGGSLDGFAARYGAPADLLARGVGLGIESITISGLSELGEAEILAAAGISSSHSLLFLDPAAVRARLRALPLVQEAAVHKLYPSRVSVTIVERQPFALWQKEGRVAVVALDGTVIDEFRNGRFAGLPFVVGEGANAHLDEYAALLDAAGDIRSRIKAGVRVADRRWDLITTDGVTLRLPEENAAVALASVVRLSREARVLDKDIVALDLRVPGRLIAQLSDDAGAARLETLTRRLGKGKA